MSQSLQLLKIVFSLVVKINNLGIASSQHHDILSHLIHNIMKNILILTCDYKI